MCHGLLYLGSGMAIHIRIMNHYNDSEGAMAKSAIGVLTMCVCVSIF